MPTLSVSSFSLCRTLGATYPALELTSGERTATYPYGVGSMTLLDVPAAVAALDIPNLEIVQYHFPRTDAVYLAELRGRLDAAGIALASLLLDAGDITAVDASERAHVVARLKDWIDVAATLGARRVRVGAGDAAPDADGAVARSVAGLAELAEYAAGRGMRLITENWRQLAMAPKTLATILEALDGRVGLCADFGNYRGVSKYDDLRLILPRAETVHAKASYLAAGQPDEADFRRCLDLARDAGFAGEYVLIFDGPGDERASLRQLAQLVQPYL
ncbi:MAG: sugar phosphate isomerase/epimerase family protein [Thermomicrobiales bacterium]